MNIRIKYTGDATWYNIEDYVIGSLKVDFSTRELDYSINTSGPTVEISDNYDYETNTIEDIEKIRLYDNLSYFYGIPSKIETVYANASKKISFTTELELLRTKKINPANLDALITATADTSKYNPSDSESRKTVAIMWIIENMFISVGLDSPNLVAGAGLTVGEKIAITSKLGYTSILFDELMTDMNMFYAINQPSAHQPVYGTGTDWDVTNELTYFEFITWFCSMFGVVLFGDTDVNGTGYRMDIEDESGIAASENYVIEQTDTDYQNSEVLYWTMTVSNDGGFRTFYYDNLDSTISDIYDNKTDFAQSQTWWNNLLISSEDRTSLGNMRSIYTYYITPDDLVYWDTYVGDKLRYIKGGDYQVVRKSITYESLPARQNTYKFSYDVVNNLLNVSELII